MAIGRGSTRKVGGHHQKGHLPQRVVYVFILPLDPRSSLNGVIGVTVPQCPPPPGLRGPWKLFSNFFSRRVCFFKKYIKIAIIFNSAPSNK